MEKYIVRVVKNQNIMSNKYICLQSRGNTSLDDKPKPECSSVFVNSIGSRGDKYREKCSNIEKEVKRITIDNMPTLRKK